MKKLKKFLRYVSLPIAIPVTTGIVLLFAILMAISWNPEQTVTDDYWDQI